MSNIETKKNEITDVAMMILQQDQFSNIVHAIVDEAAEFFDYCPGDFCLQTFGGGIIIFGSTNRLVWDPAGGFRPDKPNCTERFLENFKKVKGEG